MDALTRTIERESERFLEAVLGADPAAAVPTCPEWNVDDLLWHLTDVHGFWAEVLRSGATKDEEVEAIEARKLERPRTRDELAALCQEHTAALLAELRRLDDATPAWFWLPTHQTVGITRRMQAHEATFHRIDAELAAGRESAPIAAQVVSDAIVHAVDVMWAWWGTLPGFEFEPVGVVELAASDTGERWLLEVGHWVGVGRSGNARDEPGVRMANGGDPVATVLARVEELARWLWGRGPEPRAAEGDPEVLKALREVQAAGMQ